jgi:hypothetical protein
MFKEFEKLVKKEDLCKLLDIDPKKIIVDISIEPCGEGNVWNIEGVTADKESEINA